MEKEEENGLLMEEPKRVASLREVIFFKFVRPCIAEFIATMLFVFADVCSVSGPAAGFTHGFALFVLVAVTATVSGGHINPAVTLGMTICGGLKPILAPFYVLSQLTGGMLGALIAKAVMNPTVYDKITGGVHLIAHGVNPGQAILAELMATSVLVFAVLMVAFDERNKSVLAPMAIGLSVAAGIFAIGGISGASMNPARSFGPAVVNDSWKDHYVYWVGPALGSLFSSLVYVLVFATPNNMWIPLDEPAE